MGLAALVGGRQACYSCGVHRRMPELPGEPVVEGDLLGGSPSPSARTGPASASRPRSMSTVTNLTPRGVRNPLSISWVAMNSIASRQRWSSTLARRPPSGLVSKRRWTSQKRTMPK